MPVFIVRFIPYTQACRPRVWGFFCFKLCYNIIKNSRQVIDMLKLLKKLNADCTHQSEVVKDMKQICNQFFLENKNSFKESSQRVKGIMARYSK